MEWQNVIARLTGAKEKELHTNSERRARYGELLRKSITADISNAEGKTVESLAVALGKSIEQMERDRATVTEFIEAQQAVAAWESHRVGRRKAIEEQTAKIEDRRLFLLKAQDELEAIRGKIANFEIAMEATRAPRQRIDELSRTEWELLGLPKPERPDVPSGVATFDPISGQSQTSAGDSHEVVYRHPQPRDQKMVAT